MGALSHIKFMGILMNCTIRPLGLKVGVGEAHKVKLRDASEAVRFLLDYVIAQ